MPLSAFDQEDDPFDNFDDDVAGFNYRPASSSTELATEKSLPPRTAASLDLLNDQIEQHALHSIYLATASPEVPWTLDSS